jgi:hypothetical protein
MIEYLHKAIDSINPESLCILNRNQWFRRNIIVNRATQLYLADNLRLTYQYVDNDIVKDEHRANHHGVAIGTSLGLKGCLPRKDRYIQEANIKRQMKALFKLNNL